MKLVLLFLAFTCPSGLPQLRMAIEATFHDVRLTKLVAAAVAEAAADCLSLNLGSNLTITAAILCALLVAALILQLAQERHVPRIYWMAVALNSVAAALLSPTLWPMDPA